MSWLHRLNPLWLQQSDQLSIVPAQLSLEFKKQAKLSKPLKWGLGLGAAGLGGMGLYSALTDETSWPAKHDLNLPADSLEKTLAPASLTALPRKSNDWYREAFEEEGPYRKIQTTRDVPKAQQDEHGTFAEDSLADNIKDYYKKAPGGLEGAIERAEKANEKRVGFFPQLPGLKDSVEQKWRTNFSPDHPILTGTDGIFSYPINDDINKSMLVVRSNVKPGELPSATEQNAREHELSHAAFISTSKPGRERLEHSEPIFKNKGRSKTTDYLTNPSEIDARLADIKRQYVANHPGEDVTTPQEAEKAWNWYFTKGHKSSPSKTTSKVDIRAWKSLPTWPILRKLFFKRMPQLVQAELPSSERATEMKQANTLSPWFSHSPLQGIKPLGRTQPLPQPKPPTPQLPPNSPPPPNNRRASVVAQLGRQQGGTEGIAANIQELFNPKPQQMQALPPGSPKQANIAQLGVGMAAGYAQKALEERKRKRPLPSNAVTEAQEIGKLAALKGRC